MYTEKTFLKYRKFLNISYKNPHLNKEQLIEKYFWELADKESTGFKSESETENIKKHYPSNEILQIYSPDILDMQNSFCDNPKPQRSAVFNWSNVEENPFFELWKHAYHKKSFIELYSAFFNESVKNKYVTASAIAEKTSEQTAINKEIKKRLGPIGAVKSFSSGTDGKEEYHSINVIPKKSILLNGAAYNKILEHSRTGPCSVIGSFLTDKFFDKAKFKRPPVQSWEKKFMLPSLDSGIMYKIFDAIQSRSAVELKTFARREDSAELVFPLCVVQNMSKGDFHLIHNKGGAYCSEPIDNIRDVEKCDIHFAYDIELAKIKDALTKVWECARGYAFNNPQHVFIRLSGLDDFDEIAEYLSPVFKARKKDGCIEIHGECYNALSFIPALRRFLGRITGFDFYEETKDDSGKTRKADLQWTPAYLSDQSFYDSIKGLFEQYGIPLSKELIVKPRPSIAPIQFMKKEPRQELPEGSALKKYTDAAVLFNPFHSRDFIETAKKKNMELPITTAESRWLYSVIDYEKKEGDGLDELREYFAEQKIEKLFTKSSFIQTRKNSCTKAYEKDSGEKCLLEVSENASELFSVFPQCRNNLETSTNGKPATWFNYDAKDEEKIIPMLFELGSEIKVEGPQTILSKMTNRLKRQAECFETIGRPRTLPNGR